MARMKQKAKPARKTQRLERKSRSPAARRKSRAAAKNKSRGRRHTFIATHHRPDAFEQGLRRYAQYRDLGIVGATGGMVRAHVIKMIPPCDPAEVSKRHFHDVEFQMIYVLKGWIKGEYEGAGVVTMREGSCAGCSRRKSSIRCSTTPTIANSSRSSCRRISQRSNWNDRTCADPMKTRSLS